MTHTTYSILHVLQQQLEEARTRDNAIRTHRTEGTGIQVPGTGKAISAAYEQLRNAAEYAEEHLLLQRAIRRFCYRNLNFTSQRPMSEIGEELIVELTQAGYLQNGACTTAAAKHISQLMTSHMDTYWLMREHRARREDAVTWTLDVLCADVEEYLNPHSQLAALARSAYQHFLQSFDRPASLNAADVQNYDLCLYIATHQSLLKSDVGIVRHDLLRVYHQSTHDITEYMAFNRMVENLFNAPLTQRLKRHVSKYGAPWRIVKAMTDDRQDLPDILSDRQAFLYAFDRQVSKEYRAVKKRLTRGIVKSIVFIFITKVLIGVAIEVPYDLWVVGSVALMPLVINLLFPPLYMASLRLGLRVPSLENATALRSHIDCLLFEPGQFGKLLIGRASRRTSLPRKVVYVLLFSIPLGITVYILSLLHFNVVQGIIFFVFLSTASFLGFCLRRMVHDLELVTKQPNFFTTLRDFFYLPFILVGQWISSKYARVNAIGYILDIAIELPLKTFLRLVRQWSRFLNEKQEEIF